MNHITFRKFFLARRIQIEVNLTLFWYILEKFKMP
jgi:hypothetical protein